MSQQTIQVGEPYPSSLPQESGEGLWPFLVRGGIHLLFLTPGLRDGDLKTLRRQKVQVGTTVEESILFLSLYVKGWGALDGHMNPHQYSSDVVWSFVEDMGNAWSLIVAEGHGRSRTVRLNRVLGVTEAMAEEARDGLSRSLQSFEDGAEVEREARKVYDRYDRPADLAAACSEKCVFDAKF